MASPPAERRLGVFGGTFDPPHRGHLVVARDVLETLALDRIVFVPAGLPPHKNATAVTPAALRLEMVRAATAGQPAFEVSDLEVGRSGPSYTVDTLRALREAHPDAELFLILGADQFASMDTAWKDPEEVVRLARIVVMDREGVRGTRVVPDVRGVEGATVHVPVTRVDLSSTDIRRRVREGKEIEGLLPEPVRTIVEREGLYH